MKLFSAVKKKAVNVAFIYLLLSVSVLRAQVKVLSMNFSGLNVSPESICGITMNSFSGESGVVVEAQIKNIQGAVIIKAVSAPQNVKAGVSNLVIQSGGISNVYYINTAVGEFIRNYHQLPSGLYNYCVTIRTADGSDSDEMCEQIESESTTYLTLVSPYDKDTVSSQTPLLVWNHLESFNVLQQGEYYRMLVCEMKDGQGPEAAVTVNSPLYMANFLTRHELTYPQDAPKLESGRHYAWQVQKVLNGIITNKTEAWEFVLKAKNMQSVSGFVELTSGLNLTPFDVSDNRICFVFKEDYASGSDVLNAFIRDSKGNTLKVDPLPLKAAFTKTSELKRTERITYYIDLENLGIQDGIYVLQVLNQKKQEFLLKFRYNSL